MDAIRIVKESTWSIILRDDNAVVKAGFPTKLVESISCGTPVIANSFSNVLEYLDERNSLIVNDLSYFSAIIKEACSKKVVPNHELFDYHRYTEEIKKVLQ